MSTNAVLITISSLSLAASTATLAIVVVGAIKGLRAKKKIESDVESVKTKTNRAIKAMSTALNEIKI